MITLVSSHKQPTPNIRGGSVWDVTAENVSQWIYIMVVDICMVWALTSHVFSPSTLFHKQAGGTWEGGRQRAPPPDLCRSVDPMSNRGGRQIMPSTLLIPPPDFQTFRRLW